MLLAAALLCAPPACSPTEEEEEKEEGRWPKSFGNNGIEAGNAVAVDGDGNVAVTGRFTGAVDFGGGELTSAGHASGFVASYTPAGKHRWSMRFGGSDGASGGGVVVDDSGNVTVTGHFSGTASFGGKDLTSVGQADVFVASYTSAGKHRWSTRHGGAKHDSGQGIAVDPAGNVTVTGALDWEPRDKMSPAMDILVAGYSPGGTQRWIKQLSSKGPDSGDAGASIAADASGNVTLTGYFMHTIDFGGGPLTSAGYDDIFVASYTSKGVHRWSRGFGDVQFDSGQGVAVDKAGNVTVTGGFQGAVDFGGGQLVGGHPEIDEGFVACFSSSGKHRWSKRFGAKLSDEGRGVAVGPDGAFYVTGSFMGSATQFGSTKLKSYGREDIFVSSYSPTGAHLWSRRTGGVGADVGNGVAVDASGGITVTGSFMNKVWFDGGYLTSAGSDDIFITRVAPPP